MVIAPVCADADIDFQGKDGEEMFVFHFHQHWIRLLWPLTKLLMLNALIMGIAFTMFWLIDISDPMTRRIMLTLIILFFLIAHFEFLARFYRFFLYVIIVTDRKVHRVKKTLLTVDEHQSIDLWVLQDISKSQHGVIQMLFGYGTMVLEAQDTELRIHFTPRISLTYDKLLSLREKARARSREWKDHPA